MTTLSDEQIVKIAQMHGTVRDWTDGTTDFSFRTMLNLRSFVRRCAEEQARGEDLLALRKDAQRYRWLRGSLVKDGDDYEAFLSTRNLFDEDWPANIDAAIDAALAGAGESK